MGDFDFNDGDDFGFSLVSEDELKARELQLQKKIEETLQTLDQQKQAAQQEVEATEVELKDKLDGLRKMVMPLLNNLAKDPDKTYVFWPDRAVKIKAFIEKVNKYVDG